MQIQVLDSATIDKIAAGEVVERPASVVKELVENAIDANANRITVEVREGGIEFLRITDNGSGMEGAEVRKAFLRHATSKIRSAEDLERISSLGFRGEALSSIAAVSKVELITRTKEALTGVRYCMEGAQEKDFEEVGAPFGTTFIMRNLFFNTPARRKFLKQSPTEGGYIADLMEHMALSRPDISFQLILGGQVRFHTSGNGDLREVIYRIYGRDVAKRLIPISIQQDGIRLEGYLGRPELMRSNRNFEIYFVNGRFIRSQVIAKAIEEGYRAYTMQHKFPFCVLHLSMDSSRLDVNVHPSKMEVRFQDAPTVCRLLSGMIGGTLKSTEMIPEVSLDGRRRIDRGEIPAPETMQDQENKLQQESQLQRENKTPQESRIQQETKLQHENKVQQAEQPGQESNLQRENKVQQKDQPQKENVPRQEESYKSKEAFQTPKVIAGRGATYLTGAEDVPKSMVQEENAFFVEKVPLRIAPEREEEIPGSGKMSVGSEKQDKPEERKIMPQDMAQLNLFEEKILAPENRVHFQIIGQVFNTYWMVQFEDKLMIIDQHAAHEKVKYERLVRRYLEKEVSSQNLMPPVIVSLSLQEEQVLKEQEEIFRKFGFEVENFGGSEYALRSVPTDLYGCGEKELFLEILDGLGNESGVKTVWEKLASMACKAAVKGNNRLSVEEAQKLIDELLTLENPYNCPHGRPTIITISKTEMEKKFGRIVS